MTGKRDNGTNFVEAASELKEQEKQLDKEKILRTTTHKGTKWVFNLPSAPHFGGVFECMVKAAKKALYAVLGTSDVTDEELITACTGVEFAQFQTSIAVPLTPNHFLHGQMGGQFAPQDADMQSFNPRKRWRKVQALISRVWSRCLEEYLPTLRARPKRTQTVNDLKEISC